MLSENKFTVSELEDDLICVEVFEDAELDVPDIKRIKEITLEITKGNKYVSLVDSAPNSTITREAMSLTASPEYSQNRLAMAFIVKTLPHRIVTNFYIKFKRPNTKTRAFQSREDAIVWLREQLVKQHVYD